MVYVKDVFGFVTYLITFKLKPLGKHYVYLSPTTLRPLRVKMNNINHLTVVQDSAVAPRMLTFIWILHDTNHQSKHLCSPHYTQKDIAAVRICCLTHEKYKYKYHFYKKGFTFVLFCLVFFLKIQVKISPLLLLVLNTIANNP